MVLELLDPLRREEIRGIFAVGALASIYALRQRLDPAASFLDIKIGPLLDILLASWTSYVFLMAIGVSPDIFGKRISGFCQGLAHFLFLMGIFLMAVIVLPSLANSAIAWLRTLPPESWLLGIFLFLYVVSRVARRAKKTQPTTEHPKSSQKSAEA
jgi:hypothetical protein